MHQPAASFHALVIGTDEYPQLAAKAQLSGCVNDARSIYDFLVERVAVPKDRITLLTSPAAEPQQLSSAENIRAALRALTAPGVVRAGDHVVVFYACHGVRLQRRGADAQSITYSGMSPRDLDYAHAGWDNLILDVELNRFWRQLTQKRASVTIIADTCHSGSSTRSIDGVARERCLPDVEPLSPAEWHELVSTHPALQSDAAERGDDASASRAAPGADADYVFLGACQDTETAKEVADTVLAPDGTQKKVRHGALTSALLNALRMVPSGQLQGLRWLDFFCDLREAVSRRVEGLNRGPQRPALEGNPARPVFGGAFTPFSPGFDARRTDKGYVVDGGTLHGLGVGAQIELFPADTANLDAAAHLAVPATITEAQPGISTATLDDPAAAARLADRARARLAQPGPSWPPMLVRFVEVPEALIEAAKLEAAARRSLLVRVAPGMPAHVEVRPWTGEIPEKAIGLHGARDGFVLVRSDAIGAPALLPATFQPKPEDIIAYLPGDGPRVKLLEDRVATLGAALGEGLAHYARYLRARDHSGGDESLRAMLEVKLRRGRAATAPATDDVTPPPEELIRQMPYQDIDPKTGFYNFDLGDFFFLEVKTLLPTSLRLQVGVVACSDDGLIEAVWPAPGERYTFDAGTTTYIGKDRQLPQYFNDNGRPDRQLSYWTLKLIAYTAAPDAGPINIQSLIQQVSVQDLFLKDMRPVRSLGRPQPPEERPRGYSWNLRIACHRGDPALT